MNYLIRCSKLCPDMTGAWDSPAWQQADTAVLSHFRPEGSSHRPNTLVRLLYNAHGIFGIFRAEDRYVRCVRTAYMDEVYKDSCVEFFVHPGQGRGYFNFEFNCGGALRCSYIIDPARAGSGFKDCIHLTPDDGRMISVYHSLPSVINHEITEPVTWVLEFFIPVELLEKYAGPLGQIAGRQGRGNFYKCGDETSHPHWASWTPLDSRNFHLPRCFGMLEFEAAGAS